MMVDNIYSISFCDKTSPKDRSVSIARGIAIIAMVIGHVVPHDTLLGIFIYKWHMPLFFFFSGFFFDVDKYSFGRFACRKIKSLYIPFVFWSLFFLAVHNSLLQYHILKGDILDPHNLKVFAYRAVFEMRQYEPLLLTFWFLIQLLLTNLFCYFILFKKKEIINKRVIGNYNYFIDVFIVLLLIVGSIILCKYKIIINYHFSYITLLSMTFFILGNTLRNVDILKKYIFIISFFIVLCFGNSFHQMIELEYDYIIMYVIIAVCGIIFVYGISKIIKNVRYLNVVLAYIGDKSLSIMILHLVAFKLISYIIIQVEGLSINKLSLLVIRDVIWYWMILYAVVGVLFPLLLEKFYSYFKYLVLSKFKSMRLL